jgi:pilus assembly protein Flp/PilA
MNKQIMKFLKEEDGLTTVEYAIAGGLIGAAVIVAFGLLGGQVERVITGIMNALATVPTAAVAAAP